MAGVFKTVTFMVMVFAAVVVLAEQEDYDVGDDTKWIRPADPEFYATWAANKIFRVGDELEFDFAPGRHDVAVVTQAAYDNCEKEKPISHMTVPPVKIRLNTTGPQHFICTVGDHCLFGQKLTINVVAAGATGGAATPGAGGGATTPVAGGGASPAPGSVPSAGGTTTPTTGETTTPSGSSGTTTTPAGNAASSLGGAATFLVSFVSAVVALF